MSAPNLTGTLTLPDGTEVSVALNADGTFQQWGADTTTLGQTVDMLDAMADALRDWSTDRYCERCGGFVNDPDEIRGDDHDSHCDACRIECVLCRRLDAIDA